VLASWLEASSSLPESLPRLCVYRRRCFGFVVALGPQPPSLPSFSLFALPRASVVSFTSVVVFVSPPSLSSFPFSLLFCVCTPRHFYGSLKSRTVLVPVRDFNIRKIPEGEQRFLIFLKVRGKLKSPTGHWSVRDFKTNEFSDFPKPGTERPNDDDNNNDDTHKDEAKTHAATTTPPTMKPTPRTKNDRPNHTLLEFVEHTFRQPTASPLM
jgi:hypothetical protein